MRTVLIANTGWYLYKFRRNLIIALLSRGDVVGIVCPDDKYARMLVSEFELVFYSIPSQPRRVVPSIEIKTIIALRRACKTLSPNVCLTYTPRINCYIGLILWKHSKCKLVRNISGLGASVSAEPSLQTRIAVFLYRLSRDCHWNFYQNEEDQFLGLTSGFSTQSNTSLLPGSGVDLDAFPYLSRDSRSTTINVLMAARLIPDKGYIDFIQLASRYRDSDVVNFHLIGEFTADSGMTRVEFDNLIQANRIVFHGYVEDMADLYRMCDVFFLPSTYGEGLPRVLLEAASCGCVLVAYSNAGSNRAIIEGKNGWIVKRGSVDGLEQSLEMYISLEPEKKKKMADLSRSHVVNGFSEKIVIESYLNKI